MGPSDKPLALTLGDPAGIGPDITLLAWLAREREALPAFALLGDPDLMEARAAGLDVQVPIARISTLDEARHRFADALPVLPIPLAGPVRPGVPDVASVPAVQLSIEEAVRLALAGEAAAVVTNPISKATLYRGGFTFPGHTEYLASLAKREEAPPLPVMMLVGADLRVVPVTIHIPLKDVPGALSANLILTTIEITARNLGRLFGIARPRIAVTGLNPHAGEDGSLGREEIEIVAPAIAAARAKGLDVTGPYPADTLFHAGARKNYDAAVTMYHDQALIPVKTLAFDTGVNVTLGLPFIRTSPDHGTAFALAGTGTANPASLIAALRLAAGMSRTEARRA